MPSLTRQVYNLFQGPVEQPPLGFSIAEEKIKQFWGKTTVKLNDCFLGKTSLAKNFKMFFRGGGRWGGVPTPVTRPEFHG